MIPTLRDYSQSGEQAHVLEHAPQAGRFLDIGAGDGETFSNTRALALEGFGGVAVEPAGWAFDNLARIYPSHELVRTVAAVVTPDYMGLVPFAYSRDDHLSSTDPSHIARWERQVPFVKAYAAAITLHNLLDVLGSFEVVSIDAEGLSTSLARRYFTLPEWDAVHVLVVEREPGERLDPPGLKLVASTPNNLIYAR